MIVRKFNKFVSNERGAVAITVALLVPVLFGFAALAVDFGLLFSTQAKLRAAADAAAFAAASSLEDSGEAKNLAVEYATKNMPVSNHGNVVVASDVIIGNFDSDTRDFQAGGSPTNAVQVTARRTSSNGNPVNLAFAQVLGFDTRDVTVQSIVSVESSGGGACLLSLDPSASGAIEISGTLDISLGCGMAVTSTSSSALKISGNADIDVTDICVAGATDVGGTVDFLDATPNDGCTPPPDPLAGLAEPSFSGCDETDFKVDQSGVTRNLSPGVYCKGMEFSGSNNTINFAPDIYIINGKGFKASGSDNVYNGSGVMFYKGFIWLAC